MHVVECDVPTSSALSRDLIRTAYFHDSYRVPLARPGLSIVEIFFALFGHTPRWMKALLIGGADWKRRRSPKFSPLRYAPTTASAKRSVHGRSSSSTTMKLSRAATTST
jgi:hypothetical protein